MPEQPELQKDVNWFKRHKVLTGIVVIVLFLMVLGAATSSSTPSQNTDTPAHQLAEDDSTQTPDTSTVTQYQSALNSLTPYCNGQNQQQVANEIRETWKLLEQGGIKDETDLTVLQHIQASIPTNSPPENCPSVMSAYITLRES